MRRAKKFLFLKKKNFVWYAHGIHREDGTQMVQRDKKVQNAK